MQEEELVGRRFVLGFLLLATQLEAPLIFLRQEMLPKRSPKCAVLMILMEEWMCFSLVNVPPSPQINMKKTNNEESHSALCCVPKAIVAKKNSFQLDLVRS